MVKGIYTKILQWDTLFLKNFSFCIELKAMLSTTLKKLGYSLQKNNHMKVVNNKIRKE